MGNVKKYISDKDSRQLHAFKQHAKRYFEAYHPEAGVEFVPSTRYQRASALLKAAAAARIRGEIEGASPIASTSAIPMQSRATLGSAPEHTAAAAITGVSVKTEAGTPVMAGASMGDAIETLADAKMSTTTSATESSQAEPIDAVMTEAPAFHASGSLPVNSVGAQSATNGDAPIQSTPTLSLDATAAVGAIEQTSTTMPTAFPDATATSASTPSSASTTSKGKRRATTDSKGKLSVGQQLASSFTDAFGTADKADMAVVAIKAYKEGEFIDGLKGGVKDLTREEDEQMKIEAAMARDRLGPGQIAATAAPARDFSVIRSAQKGCSQLLLGPARFVNHDCNPNVEFYRSGQSITFRCTRPIQPKDEITCYYGPNYFELNNAECLCATCELNGRGAFSVLAGTRFSTMGNGLGQGSPELSSGGDVEMVGFSPGPEGSASSANSVNGSEASSSGTATAHGTRRSSARVAMVQASGRTRRMTPGGVPFPSMSLAPSGGYAPSSSRKHSPSGDTNGSSASAAEVDGGIGLGVGLPVSGGSGALDGRLNTPAGLASLTTSHGLRGKVLTLTCRTCRDPFEWHATWYAPQGECSRCVRHEKIYRTSWPNRKGEAAIEARQWKARAKADEQARLEALLRKSGASASTGAAATKERPAKKARTSKKRGDPVRIAVDGSVAGASTKQTNGSDKGKGKATQGASSPNTSLSLGSGSGGLSFSDSDLSDLTDLDEDEEMDFTPTVTASRTAGTEDGDTTLSAPNESKDAIKDGDGPQEQAKKDPDPDPKPKPATYADYESRYGPTGKAERSRLDFEARRREKKEPPWTKADDEDRRRSSRRRGRGSKSTPSKATKGEAPEDSSRRSRRDGGSSSSSSRDSSPAGPPVLGKDANLQNLADFWGATDGERRVRRPVLSGGVTSLLERQRAVKTAKQRAKEREEAKAERRWKADLRRRGSEGGTAVKTEKLSEDAKPRASSRRSQSPIKTGRGSLDSALANKAGKKVVTLMTTATTTITTTAAATSSRKSVDSMQPVRTSNRQALRRDRLLAGFSKLDDEEEDDAEEEDSDDDFSGSDISSDDEADEEDAMDIDAKEEDAPTRSERGSTSNGKRTQRNQLSDQDEDDSQSSGDDSDDASQVGDHSNSSSLNRKKKRFVFSRSSSPVPVIPGLATKGPERTSNANLALAWSAGVAEGAKRTRKPVQRDPVAVTKIAAPSTTRGRTSETPKPPIVSASSQARSRVRSNSETGEQEHDRKRRARASPTMSVASASSGSKALPHRHSATPVMPRSGSSSSGLGVGNGRLLPGPGQLGKPNAGLQHPGAQRVMSGSSVLAPLPGGPSAAALNSRRYSSSSASQPESPMAMLYPLPSPANPPVPGFRRPASPAGTSLSLVPVAAGAQGAMAGRSSGAPRRNLRWGSGKVTHSRPSPHLAGGGLPSGSGNGSGSVGGGSTSPIGAAAGSGASSSSAGMLSQPTPASFGGANANAPRPASSTGSAIGFKSEGVGLPPPPAFQGASDSPAGSPLMGVVGGQPLAGPPPSSLATSHPPPLHSSDASVLEAKINKDPRQGSHTPTLTAPAPAAKPLPVPQQPVVEEPRTEL